VFPTTSWNYALNLDASDPAKSITEKHNEAGGIPFGRKNVPVELRVKARKLPAWRAEDGAADPLPQSPVSTDTAEEEITLVPYAAAKLRITAFPVLKS
jgi:hypothetical protein